MRRLAPRLPALLAAVLVVSSTVTCSESATGPKSGLRAIVGLTPAFSKAATDIYRNLVSFELAVNNVRVRLERANGEIALDTTVAIVPGQDSIVLQLSVPLKGSPEVLDALIELRDGDEVLFSGTQTITARVGIPSEPPPPIALEYSGPGATAVSLDVEPDTTISARDSLSFRPIARDANSQVLGNLRLNWTLNDATMGEVTANGLFRPSGKRGPATVTAELPTGIQGAATVTVVPVPTTITLVSGGGQTATVGTAVAQPVVVELRAADNLTVAGHVVDFAVSAGGGSVAPTRAVTDENGRASALMTLGTAAGTNSVAVSVTGLSPMTVSATATAGAATKLAIAQQPASTASSGAALATQPSIQLQDVFGNAVSAAGIEVTASLAVPPGGRTLAGTVTATTNTSGVAGFTNLSIAGPTGTATLTFSAASLTGVTSNAITVVAGAAGSMTVVTTSAFTDTAGSNVIATHLPSVVVQDAASNPVPGVQVTFRRHGGAGSSINAQTDTMVVVTTGANGGAALSARRLQTSLGVDTVLVTTAGLNDTLSFVATVTHANAAQLAYTQQPSNGTAGATLSPAIVVAVRDQFGNAVTTGAGATASVSMALVDGTLSGTSTVSAVGGVATFDALTVQTPGGAHQLVASSSGLASATSTAFSIAGGSATTRTWTAATNGNWEDAANWSGGVIPGALDTAAITLAGEYTVTVNSTVSVGKVIVGGGVTGIQLLAVHGGTSRLTVSDSVRIATSGALVLGTAGGGTVLSSGPLLNHGVMQLFQGTIAGSGSITNAADAAMALLGSGAMAIDGRALQNAGNLIFSAPATGHLTLSNGASIANQTGAEFLVQSEADILQGTGALASIANSGSYRKTFGNTGVHSVGVYFSNNGVLESQSGTIAFAGTATSNNPGGTITGIGTIDISGTAFSNNGTIAPGFSPGQLAITGSLLQQSNAVLAIEVNGSSPGSQHDQLNVSGALTLGGTLAVTFGFTPTVGQTFTIANAGSAISGAFANVTGLDVGEGLVVTPVVEGSALFLLVENATAPTKTWTSPVSGNWSDGANWSGGTPPTSSDVVGIQVAGTYTVTLDVDATVAGLMLGTTTGTQSLVGESRTLTVNGGTTVSAHGSLSLSSSTFMGSGTLTNLGTAVFTSSAIGALSNHGTVTVHGITAFNGELSTSAGSTLRIKGQAGPGDAVLTTAFGFTNEGLIELTSDQEHGSQLTVTNSLVINAVGAIIRSAPGQDGGPRTLAAQLTNFGTLDVDAPLTLSSAHADHVNNGTINLTVSDLTVTQSGSTPSFTNSGLVDIGFGRSFSITGGTFSNGSAGVIAGTGTLNVAGTASGHAGIMSPQGTSAVGTLHVAGPYVQSASASLAIELSGASQHDVLSVSGAATLGGTLNVTLIHGFVPAATNTFVIMTFGSSSGSFDTVNLPALPAGLEWDVQVDDESHVQLVVMEASPTSVSWIGASGNWSNGANWSTGIPPTSTDVVSLRGTTNYTVTLDVDATVAGLRVGGTDGTQVLTATGRALTVNGSTEIEFTGMVILAHSNFAGTGTIAQRGELQFLNTSVGPNVAINNEALLDLEGGTVINGLLTTTESSELLILGNTTFGAASVEIVNGFTNNGVLNLTGTNGFASTLTVTNGTLVNGSSGVLQTLQAGARTLNAQLDNQGTLDNNVPLTINKAGADHVNSGTIEVQADLTITQSGTTPSFTNTSSGQILLGANDDLEVTGGTLSLNQGSINGPTTARIIVTGASLAMTAAVVNGVPLTLNSTTLAAGSLTIGDGEIVRLQGGTVNEPVNVLGGSSFGTLSVSGTVSLNGALTIGALGVVSVFAGSESATTLTVANGFTNNGRVELNGFSGNASTLVVNGTGVLTNANGGVIRAFNSGAKTLTATLVNQQGGTLDVDTPLTINMPGADHQNAGFIDLGGGSLDLILDGTTPTFTNATGLGAVDLGTVGGRTFTVTVPAGVTGAVLDIGAGTVSGGPLTQLVTAGSGTLTIASTFNTASIVLPLRLGANTVFAAPISIPINERLILMGNGGTSTLNADVSLAASGSLLLAHGTVQLNGAVTIAPEATLRVQGQATGGNATVTVANGFTNNGLIQLTSTTAADATLNVTTGSLTNADGGVIRSTGEVGSRTLGAQLINQLGGTVDVDVAMTINKLGADHVNSGTIDIDAIAFLTLNQLGTTPSFQQTSSGSVTMGHGASWTVAGGTLDLGQGSVESTGQGLLTTTGSVALTMTPSTVLVPVKLSASTTIAGGSITIPAGRALTLHGAGGISTLNANVTVQGDGTLLVWGTSTVNGTVTVQNGADFRIRGQNTTADAIATVSNGVTNNGNLYLESEDAEGAQLNVTSGQLTNAQNAQINVVDNGARTLNAEIANAGTLFVATPLTITRPNAAHTNTSTGTITMNAGLTIVQSGSPATFSNTGNIAINGNGLTVSGGTFTNTLADAVAITGPGTLDVSSTTFTNNGTLQPNGILNVTGNYTQSGVSGVLRILMGNTGCSSYDQLHVSGTATLAGTLQVMLNDCVPALGDYTVLTAGSRIGTFADILGTLPGIGIFGRAWEDQSQSTNIVLRVVNQ